jgi:hypothetical protein
MFWFLGAYAPFILKCIFDTFSNVNKFQTKNSCVHLHMLRAHKVLPWKVDFSFRLCKKTKFDAKKIRLLWDMFCLFTSTIKNGHRLSRCTWNKKLLKSILFIKQNPTRNHLSCLSSHAHYPRHCVFIAVRSISSVHPFVFSMPSKLYELNMYGCGKVPAVH